MIEPKASQTTVHPEIVVPPEQSLLPDYPQPWETASFVLGVPGAFVGSILLCGLVMGAPGWSTVFTAIAVTIVAVYPLAMGVLWLGVAHENRG